MAYTDVQACLGYCVSLSIDFARFIIICYVIRDRGQILFTRLLLNRFNNGLGHEARHLLCHVIKTSKVRSFWLRTSSLWFQLSKLPNSTGHKVEGTVGAHACWLTYTVSYLCVILGKNLLKAFCVINSEMPFI